MSGKPMDKLELKNVEWNKSYSKATHCYRLTVYWEGERAFKASNDGSGAHTEYHSCKDHSEQAFESLFKTVADQCIEHVTETNPAFFEEIVSFVSGRMLPDVFEIAAREGGAETEDLIAVTAGGVMWLTIRWLRGKPAPENAEQMAHRIAGLTPAMLARIG